MSNKPTQTIVPKLRFPEFSGNWEKKRLGDVAEVNPQSSEIPERFIYIDLECVQTGMLLNQKIINKTDAPIRAQRVLQIGDVLYSTVRPYQKNNLYFEINELSVASTGFAQLRAKHNANFLYQFVHNDNFVAEVMKLSTGSNYPVVNPSDLIDIISMFPHPDEQAKIAAFLETVDELIAAEVQKLEALKDHKKGLMQQLFPAEGKTLPNLRFPEFSGNWEEKRLGDVANKTASSLSANQIKEVDEGYLVYGADGIIGRINTFQIEAPYFGVVKDGAGVGTVFKCEAQSSVLGTIDAIKATPPNSTDFVYHLFSNFQFHRFISGSTIPHIYFSDYSQSFLRLPHPDEQAKLADCLSSMDDLITAQSKKIKLLQDHKKGLMQQLFPQPDEEVMR